MAQIAQSLLLNYLLISLVANQPANLIHSKPIFSKQALSDSARFARGIVGR